MRRVGLAVAACALFLLGAAEANAATYVVTDVSDVVDSNPGDDVCDTTVLPGDQCSLRAAILEANSDTTQDFINFNIPGDGVHKIVVAGPDLPTITQPVEIDGYTQPGASPNTNPDLGDRLNTKIMVEVSGSAVTFGFGSTDSDIRGLAIGGASIGVQAFQVASVSVQGCFLGTNAKGTKARPNGTGYFSQEPGFIGGSDPEDRNLVSGNTDAGVSLNGSGIAIGNYIGTEADGRSPLPNGGPGMFDSGDGLVQQNIIAFNEDDGIRASNNAENGNNSLYTGNLIYRNKGQAIDIDGDGPDVNDPLDADTGRQNYPVIKSAKQGEGNTTIIRLKLNSTPSTEFDLEVFEGKRKKPDAERLIGTSDSVFTNANGKFSQKYTLFSRVKTGHRVTATATDVAVPPLGATSELSKGTKVK